MNDVARGGASEGRSPLETLGEVWRITLNNGLSTLYVAMALAALVLCCLRGLTERISINGTRSAVLNRMMKLRQEPLRPDTLPILSAAVLGEGVTQWSLCGDGDGLGKHVDQKVADAAKTFWSEYDDAVKQTAPPPDLVPIKQKQVEGVRTALTEKDQTKAAVTIPSGLADYWPNAGGADPTQLAARVRASRVALEKLTPHVEGVSGSEAAPTVIRYFFISTDGFMRYTPSVAGTGTPAESPLPPHRTFNHTSYMLETLSGTKGGCGEAYESVPYFDILGGGVVMTSCRRMPLKSDAANPAHGVLCADVTLPRSKLLDDIKGNHLVTGDFFVYGTRSGRLEQCSSTRTTVNCKPGARKEAGAKAAARVKAWLDELKDSRASGYAGASVLTSAAKSKRYQYAAVLWRDAEAATPATATTPSATSASPEETVGLVLFDVPPYTFDWISWLWMLGGLVCLTLLVYALARARVTIANARVFALQRGLSVGVVQVNENDGILGVNDRAEFLIGDFLPRLGLKSRRGVPNAGDVTFRSFVDGDLVVVMRDDDKKLVLHEYGDLAKLRIEGVSNRYWVRLRNKKRWLRVMGAPVFEPHDAAREDANRTKRKDQATVGLLEPAEPSMTEELDRILDEAIARHAAAKGRKS